MKKLYKWKENFRAGTLEGVFVAEESDMYQICDVNIYLGEVLGKHSEIQLKFTMKDFTVLTEDQNFIEQFVKLVGQIGYNPFDSLPEEYEDDEQ